MRLLPILSAAALAVAASSATASEKPAAATTPTAAQLVAARTSSFMMSAGALSAMKHTIDAGEDVNKWAFGARGLSAWAASIPSMFPAGTNIAGSKALPTVWSDAPGFAAIAAKYSEDAAKLADLAKANDKAGFAAQWAVVRSNCESCHKTYRAE